MGKKVIITYDVIFKKTKIYNSNNTIQEIDIFESLKLLLEVVKLNLIQKLLAKDLKTDLDLTHFTSDNKICFNKSLENRIVIQASDIIFEKNQTNKKNLKHEENSLNIICQL